MMLPVISNCSAITLLLMSLSIRFCPSSSFHNGCNLHKNNLIFFSKETLHNSYSHDILSRNSLNVPNSSRDISVLSTKIEEPSEIDGIFGAEFTVVEKVPQEEKTFWRGNIQYTEITPEKRGKVMEGYDNLRVTFLLDNLFISALGLCLLWSFGTFKDAFSYSIGSVLGLGYAALLARYVESLGSKSGGGAGGGAARFAPVVLLILLYSKNKEYISIVPEIMGFFTFQVASLLQIFNEDAYGESEGK